MKQRVSKKKSIKQGEPLPGGPLRIIDAPLRIAFRGIRNSLVATDDGPWLMLMYRIGNDTTARYYANIIVGDPKTVGAWHVSNARADVFYFKAIEVITGERIWPARALAPIGGEVDPLNKG